MRRRTTGSRSRPVRFASSTRLEHRLLEPRDAVDPEPRAFVRERTLCDRPTAVELTDEVLARHDDIGEEHLGELGLAVDVAERSRVDPGRVHVDDEQRDATVLRRRRVGAHVAEALVGDGRVARPDLLTVDDEFVVVHLGRGFAARRDRNRRSARSSRCTRWCRRESPPARASSARRSRTRAGSARRSRSRGSAWRAGFAAATALRDR